jgi:hypothetical protein
MDSSLRVIVTGLIAQHRLLGGVTWDYLNFVLGLHQLGHEVYYLEDSGEWPYNLDGGPSGDDWVAHDPTPNVEYLASVMNEFELSTKWAYHFPTNSEWFGLPEEKRKELIRSADILINVSGTLEMPAKYTQIPRLVYIDTDPVFTHIEVANGNSGLGDRVSAHDVHFTVGECLGEDLRDTGHRWYPTKHPIVLSQWLSSIPHQNTFTTVMNWTSYKPIAYRGQTYSQKDVELVKFMTLPQKIHPIPLEVALPKLHHVRWQGNYKNVCDRVEALIGNDQQWTPHEILTQLGWRVVDATDVCGDYVNYRRYIQSSKGEWSVAKNGYVEAKSGWFSGRSACYLAAGRPVIVQDTGFSQALPVGEGVVGFKTLDEAEAGIREVEGNYNHHAKAAREIAEAYFESDKVLNRLLEIATNTKSIGARNAV